METSGYTTSLQETIGLSSQFSDIEMVYTSPSGYTRLFRAMRYGKRFMLKSLKPEYLLTPVYQQALRKEFEIGFQLDHPNICRTIGFEQVESLGHAIILEYIDGFTLAEAMEQHETQLLNDIKSSFLPGGELFSALQYIHSKQIVHRDLKPSNIMITHNGHTIKVIDFSLSDSDAFGILKQPAGTREYLAPEQLLQGTQADVRADIYSLGVILRKLATTICDKHMSALATVCCQRDITLRPSSVQQISNNISTKPHTKYLKSILLAVLVSAALALMSFIYLNLRSKGYC